jgi:quinol monooxygenase YgiN
MPIDVLVLIPAKPGKEKRGVEVLTDAIERIRIEEPYTLSYHWYRTQGDEENTVDFVVYGR